METLTIVRLAEIYAKHVGLKLSSVSTYVADDGKLFASFQRGAGCTVKRANKLVDWFDGNWPADLEWPSDIPRPQPKREVA